MRTLIGKIIKAKTPGMAVVEVVRFSPHPLYKKRMRKTTKLHVVYTGEVKIGDRVKIGECKPVSKTKNWKIISQVKEK